MSDSINDFSPSSAEPTLIFEPTYRLAQYETKVIFGFSDTSYNKKNISKINGLLL